MNPNVATPAHAAVATLAKPSGAYKRQAWFAVASLILFLVAYLGLAVWFIYTAYRLGAGMVQGNFDLVGLVVAFCAAFLGIFMLKSLFFVRRGDVGHAIQITAKDQPRLFEFLHEIADSVGAPQPHKVYVSPDVNACVFYDLSIANLFFPSRKNLEIGLGLVNVLSVGEFRAVLAHEFGHFAQRAMAVGRWTYTAQQIAGHLIAQRGMLDDFLSGLSRTDFRIAWVGWVLRLIVWSIRSLVETLFTGVIIIQRSLSREMEFQADLVSVSLTGSDALIHALYKLQSADDAWGRAVDLAFGQKGAGRITRDVFELQTEVQRAMGRLLNETGYGTTPPIPSDRPESHKLFKQDMAQPPRMWLTHPLNHEREANAKKTYISRPIDDRSAWAMFDQAAELREAVTNKLMGAAPEGAAVAQDEVVKVLNEQFGREYLMSKYWGIYLNRSIVRHVASPADLYERVSASGDFYPETLAGDIERLRSLQSERDQLRAIRDGALSAQDGRIQHRGTSLKRNEVPAAIAQVDDEISQVENSLQAHDKRCRGAHLGIAERLGNGWAEYLKGLLAVHHYADHAEADIRDAAGMLRAVVNLETVTRKVSDAGAKRIVAAASDLYQRIQAVFEAAPEVKLDSVLMERLGEGVWAEALGELKLNPPNRENLGDWLNVADSWVEHTAGLCGALRRASLDQLLLTESSLATLVRLSANPKPAVAPSTVPATYATLLPGKERVRPATLGWWAKFQSANGLPAAIARFTAAAAITGSVLSFGMVTGMATVTLYNGLARPVVVKFGNQSKTLAPFSHTKLDVEPDASYPVAVTTVKGEEIERYDANVTAAYAQYLYSVAGATPLVEWTATYGNGQARPDRLLGAPRWINVSVDHLFTEPPKSISSKSGGNTRTVISATSNTGPMTVSDLITDQREQARITEVHARWDAPEAEHTLFWIGMAAASPNIQSIIKSRLVTDPKDLIALRAEQDTADSGARQEVCNRHRASAASAGQSADWYYLAARCLETAGERDAAFLEGNKRWPDHGWLAYAAGSTNADWGRWEPALSSLEAAMKTTPALRELAATDVARLLRMSGKAQSSRMEQLAGQSRQLSQVLRMESPDAKDIPEVRAYADLAKGNLDAALKLSEKNEYSLSRMLRLTAASDGASAELVGRALALKPDKGLDPGTLGSALGLMLREGRDGDLEPILAKLPKAEQRDIALSVIAAIKAREPAEIVHAKINGVDMDLRSQLYVMATIVYREKALASWRKDARALSFLSERPYFKS
jgi:Zn-dependent protease with chaperone function